MQRPGSFIPGNTPVPTTQTAGWASKSVWTGTENVSPTGIPPLDRPPTASPYPCHLAHLVPRLKWVKLYLHFAVSRHGVVQRSVFLFHMLVLHIKYLNRVLTKLLFSKFISITVKRSFIYP